VTELYVSTILTRQVIDCQIHAIGKAIRPLFAGPVTIIINGTVFALKPYITILEVLCVHLICSLVFVFWKCDYFIRVVLTTDKTFINF